MGGITYAWSIFQAPLIAYHGWDSNQVTLAYSLSYVAVLAAVFALGPLQQRFKPRYLLLASGLIQGAGFFLASFAQSIPMLYLTYSLLAGFGNGAIYSIAVSAATKWFPDKKGLANGICVGCMGLAPLVWAPFGNALIASFDVTSAFRIIGVVTIIAFLVIPWVVEAPDPEWKPAGWNPPVNDAADRQFSERRSRQITGSDFTVAQMIKQPLYWVLLLMTMCSCTSGLMMTGQTAVMAVSIAHVNAAQGALLVGLLAAFSFAGRMVFGALSDKLGRLNTQLALLVATTADMLFLFPHACDFLSFLLSMGVIGMCFGGVMAMLPSLVSDCFGTANFSVNYPFVYMGYTAASFSGPLLANSVFASTGAYSSAFLVAAGIGGCGIVLALAAKVLA